MTEPLAFRARGNRRLRRAGARGNPLQVALDGAWLEIAGADGAPPLRLPVAAIARMRSGFSDARGGPFYATVLWPQGEQPIRLAPLQRQDRYAYAAFVRALAARVAATHGLRAVERGESQFDALLGPVLSALVVPPALAVSIFLLADQPPYLRWLPAVIPLLAFAVLIWSYQTIHRPRPVEDLAELDRQLPR